MRAVQVTSLGGPDALEIAEVPAPVHDAMVSIQVKAAGVAFPDLLQSRGLYQFTPDLPFTPGAEVAGIVLRAPGGSGLQPGDRVAALCLLGGFAEEVLADPSMTFQLPDGVPFAEGAAFLFNYATAYFGLVERGGLEPGETVLVHGAAGGVGSAAVQVAKAFGAGRVIAVVSTDDKAHVARSLGADDVVNAEDFREAVGCVVDIVVDPVGGSRFTDSLRTLRENGRLLVVGFTAGEIPTVKVNRLLLNNISIVGVGWGASSFAVKGRVASQWTAMLPHLLGGALRPVVGQVFPLERAAEALSGLERREGVGKTLLAP
jgi:NADPH2:quinone reductase